MTPSCLQELYGIPTDNMAGSGVKIAVSAFDGEYFAYDDLEVSAFLNSRSGDVNLFKAIPGKLSSWNTDYHVNNVCRRWH